jgi:hypothetical protein
MTTLLVAALPSNAAAQALVQTQLLTPSARRELLNGPSAFQVQPPRVDDPAGDGAIIGALAGAGVAAAWMTIGYANCDGSCDAPARGPMYLAAMSISAGAGAVTGWVVDKLHKGKGAIVTPVVTKDRKGLALTMRF